VPVLACYTIREMADVLQRKLRIGKLCALLLGSTTLCYESLASELLGCELLHVGYVSLGRGLQICGNPVILLIELSICSRRRSVVIVKYAGILNNELPKYSASCLCGLKIGICPYSNREYCLYIAYES
jgi:hypothetical protein